MTDQTSSVTAQIALMSARHSLKASRLFTPSTYCRTITNKVKKTMTLTYWGIIKKESWIAIFQYCPVKMGFLAFQTADFATSDGSWSIADFEEVFLLVVKKLHPYNGQFLRTSWPLRTKFLKIRKSTFYWPPPFTFSSKQWQEKISTRF